VLIFSLTWPRMAGASDRFWPPERPVSRTFLDKLRPPAFQALDTQLGARNRRLTPTIHRGRAQRTSSAGSLDEIREVAGCDPGAPGRAKTSLEAIAAVARRALPAAGTPEISTFLYQLGPKLFRQLVLSSAREPEVPLAKCVFPN
jgi:hypothetical protein